MHVRGYRCAKPERRRNGPPCLTVIDPFGPGSLRKQHRCNQGGAAVKTKLSKILYDKGWTEMELSRRTGLAQSYINRVKNSRIVPTVRTALKICRALEVPVEEAFVYEDKPYGVTHAAFFPRLGAGGD